MQSPTEQIVNFLDESLQELIDGKAKNLRLKLTTDEGEFVVTIERSLN